MISKRRSGLTVFGISATKESSHRKPR